MNFAALPRERDEVAQKQVRIKAGISHLSWPSDQRRGTAPNRKSFEAIVGAPCQKHVSDLGSFNGMLNERSDLL